MTNEITDTELKRLIKRRAIKNCCKSDGAIVYYGGHYYYVDLKRDIVVLQLVHK